MVNGRAPTPALAEAGAADLRAERREFDTADGGANVPTARERLTALLLAALCATLYLGAALLPGTALVPFVPECTEPMRSAALESGASVADLERGNLSMGDKYHQSLTWDHVLATRLRAGEVPLWTRDIGGGAPFVPQMAQVYQPWNLLLLVLEPTSWYGPVVWLHLVLLGYLAYALFRRLGCRHASAAFGVVLAILGLWMQGRVHQNVVISAALPLFWMLSSVHDVFAGRRVWRASGCLALATGWSWLGGFAPVSLQATYITVCFALLLAVQRRRARELLWVGVALSIGAMIAAAQMVPTLLAAAETARAEPTVADLAGRGLPLASLLGLWWPDLITWPDPGSIDRVPLVGLLLIPVHLAGLFQFTENAISIGCAGTLALFGLAAGWRSRDRMSSERRRICVLFAVLAVLAFLLATASSPGLWLSGWIPGGRAGDLRRFAFTVHIGWLVLAVFGADRWLSVRRPIGSIVCAVLVSVVSAIGLWMLRGGVAETEAMFTGWIASEYGAEESTVRGLFAPGEVAGNRARLLATGWRALLMSAAVLGLLFASVRRRALGLQLLSLLAMLELLHAGAGNRIAVPAERVATAPSLLDPLLAATAAAGESPRPRLLTLHALDDQPPRGLFVANQPGYWGVEHLCAYSPLPKRRMEELFLALEPNRPGKPGVVGLGGSGVRGLYDPASVEHPLLDLLGVQWIVSSAGPLASDRLVDRTPDGVPEGFALFERRGAMPRATFVDTARSILDPVQRLRELGDPRHDPRREVLLEDPMVAIATGDGVGDAQVEVVSHADEVVVVRVANREPGYLRLADPHDAGWTATDAAGRQLRVLVADHYLRAVRLEPGEHEITFRFDGWNVRWPRWVAFVGLLCALGLVFAGGRRYGGRASPVLSP